MIDHTPFIEKHQPQKTSIGQKDNKGRRLMLVAGLSIFTLYILLVTFIIQNIDENNFSLLIIVLVFISATLVAFVARRAQHLQALQETELILLKQILEDGERGHLIINNKDNAHYHNQKILQMCDTEQISYQALVAMFSNNDKAEALFNSLREKAHRGLNASIELYCAKRDSEGWYHIAAQPVAGHEKFIHWRLKNVTQRHDQGSEVRQEREQLIDFTDNAPVGFFSLDEEGRFIFANATFARWLGLDLSEILYIEKLHTYLVNPPTDARPYDIISKQQDTQIAEVELKGAGGKIFLSSINQTMIQTPDGAVRTRAIVHDVTAEREMKQALQASEDRFQKFYEEAPLGIILVDEKGLIEECNGQFAQMIGTSPEKLSQKHFNLLIADDDRKAVLEALNHTQDGRDMIESLDISLKSKNGDHVATQLHARRFGSSGGTVLHFIDITDKKSLEQQFVQSQKMQAVGQLAGGIAHDFNNLLTAIIGFCDLLLLRHKPGDPSFGDIMQIKQNSNRAANLVGQLLAFSRQQTLRQRVHDMTDILTELSHLLRRLIGASVELEIIHGSDLSLVKVDEGQMEQVMINLAVNARDAMDGKGKLMISTENYENKSPQTLMEEEMPPGEWVLITVQDTGCGISEENMERILEPFFTTKDVGQGTGLGLATVHGIIRQSDGFLDINSELDKGTEFKVYLPKASEDEIEEKEQQTIEQETKDLTGSERVLLVEDEDAVRTFSQRALTNKGYEVLCAEHGEAALALFEQEENKNIDLLITDVVMPGIDGPTVANKIREECPNLKIIFVSGYTEDKLKDHMDDNTWFLPKPFTLKGLAAKVKEVLED